MLQNARLTAFTVFEILRENQQGEGNYTAPPGIPPLPPGLNHLQTINGIGYLPERFFSEYLI